MGISLHGLSPMIYGPQNNVYCCWLENSKSSNAMITYVEYCCVLLRMVDNKCMDDNKLMNHIRK